MRLSAGLVSPCFDHWVRVMPVVELLLLLRSRLSVRRRDVLVPGSTNEVCARSTRTAVALASLLCLFFSDNEQQTGRGVDRERI